MPLILPLLVERVAVRFERLGEAGINLFIQFRFAGIFLYDFVAKDYTRLPQKTQ
jgi:hypothetical protein